MNAYVLPGLDSKMINYSFIQKIVEDHFGLKQYTLTMKTRVQHIAIPRQIAMYFTRKYTPLSFIQIANAFNKNHATVIYACRQVQNIIDIGDIIYADHVAEIENTINNHISNRHDRKESDYPVEHSTGVFQKVPAPLAAGQ